MEATFEHAIGADQVLAGYVAPNSGRGLDPQSIMGWVAGDAARRAALGWKIASLTTMPMRQMGTAGNIFFQSGGQFITQVAVAVVYERA